MLIKRTSRYLPFPQQKKKKKPEANKACKSPGEHDSTAPLHEWWRRNMEKRTSWFKERWETPLAGLIANGLYLPYK